MTRLLMNVFSLTTFMNGAYSLLGSIRKYSANAGDEETMLNYFGEREEREGEERGRTGKEG